MARSKFLPIVAGAVLVFGFVSPPEESSAATKLCVRKVIKADKRGRIKLQRAVRAATDECPSGYVEFIPDITGPAGADGQLRIYGDESAGDLVVSSNLILSGGSYQFSSITVEAGSTLTVRSGTVLRSTGDVHIHGTILVTTYATTAIKLRDLQ